LQEVGTNVTGLRRILHKTPARVNPATRDEAFRMTNMTPEQRLPFETDLSIEETDAKTWTVAAMEEITAQQV